MRLSDLKSGASLVERSTRDRGLFAGAERTDCELKQWWFTFQKQAASLQIPLRVVWGFRSWEEQQAVFDKGHSKARPGESPHNYGLALDVIHAGRGWRDMPKEGWRLLFDMGQDVARRRELDLTCGWQWGWDYAHWQVTDWRKMVAQPSADPACNAGCLPQAEMTFPKAPKPPDPPAGERNNALEDYRRKMRKGERGR